MNIFRMTTAQIQALTPDDIGDISTDDLFEVLVDWSKNLDRITAVIDSIKRRMTRLGFTDYNQREYLQDAWRVLNGFDDPDEYLEKRATGVRNPNAYISIHDKYAEISVDSDSSVEDVLWCYGWRPTGENSNIFKRDDEIGALNAGEEENCYRFDFTGRSIVR